MYKATQPIYASLKPCKVFFHPCFTDGELGTQRGDVSSFMGNAQGENKTMVKSSKENKIKQVWPFEPRLRSRSNNGVWGVDFFRRVIVIRVFQLDAGFNSVCTVWLWVRVGMCGESEDNCYEIAFLPPQHLKMELRLSDLKGKWPPTLPSLTTPASWATAVTPHMLCS